MLIDWALSIGGDATLHYLNRDEGGIRLNRDEGDILDYKGGLLENY